MKNIFTQSRRDEISAVPPFDHALNVNNALDAATIFARFASPVDLCSNSKSLFVADGSSVKQLNAKGKPELLFDVGDNITAMAALNDGIACALDGRMVRIFGGKHDGMVMTGPTGAAFRSVNAMSCDGQRLLVTDGSLNHAPQDWRTDLMTKGNSGRLFSIDLASGATTLVKSGLHYAFGAASTDEGTLVSESWAHRLILVTSNGETRNIESELPAYPARIAPASDGFWLSMSCVRSELVEFVLREPDYCKRLVESIDPHLWIAPQLRSSGHAQEIAPWGANRQQGTIRPWAPTLSYGLLVKLDRAGKAQFSLHSRSGGAFHGVLAATEFDGALYVLSRGARAVLKLDIAMMQKDVLQ